MLINKQVPESLAAIKMMYIRPRIVRGKAKYDDARLSLRHFKSEKNFARASQRIPITYAIVTSTSKVNLKPWCCRLFSIHGYLRGFENTILARILFLFQERKNFNGFCLPIALLVFTWGQWRQGLLCVFQSLPHADFGCVARFAEWFCVRPSLLSPAPLPRSPVPHLKSPLP